MTTEISIDRPTSPLRGALLRLALLEEQRALADAAAVPYWKPCPPSVDGHRFAAAALRDAAGQVDTLPTRLAS